MLECTFPQNQVYGFHPPSFRVWHESGQCFKLGGLIVLSTVTIAPKHTEFPFCVVCTKFTVLLSIYCLYPSLLLPLLSQYQTRGPEPWSGTCSFPLDPQLPLHLWESPHPACAMWIKRLTHLYVLWNLIFFMSFSTYGLLNLCGRISSITAVWQPMKFEAKFTFSGKLSKKQML